MLGGIIFYHNGEAASDYRAIWGCVMVAVITEHSIKHYTIMESCRMQLSHTDRHYIYIQKFCKLMALIYLSDACVKHAWIVVY